MKQKFFSLVFILITLLVVSTGSALADGSVLGMSVTNGGGGATFTFHVTGYLSPSQLNGGYVQVQGGDAFDLHCAQTDEFTVVCHASKKVIGNVVVGFGGSTFWADMPEPSLGAPQQYCYTLFDLISGSENLGWQPFDEYCMDREAVTGDTYVTYNPYTNQANWTYHYELTAPQGWGNNPGEGYYPISN